ncbi:MAG TPA: YceI family protein [Limnochordia bacterium]
MSETTLTSQEEPTRTSVWTIDPSHSGISFSVRHMMISTVRGRFDTFSGQVIGDPPEWRDAKVSVEIDAASINTRDPQRDAHLRSGDFLETDRFPKITFQSTRIRQTGENTFDIEGDLTIRGVTRSVTLHARFTGQGKDPWGGERAAFEAETELDRRDFGVTFNTVLETGGVLVGDRLRVSIELELVRQA